SASRRRPRGSAWCARSSWMRPWSRCWSASTTAWPRGSTRWPWPMPRARPPIPSPSPWPAERRPDSGAPGRSVEPEEILDLLEEVVFGDGGVGVGLPPHLRDDGQELGPALGQHLRHLLRQLGAMLDDLPEVGRV